eukprot:GGOE01014186.1.p1 GENE.GGOE01014186.1~~GGOE01014186.1.p1  ORF type:complete len:504 (-),score=178.61 GGOE01014186.1:124-1584(-)
MSHPPVRAVFLGTLDVVEKPAAKRPRATHEPPAPSSSSSLGIAPGPAVRDVFVRWLGEQGFSVSPQLDLWAARGTAGRGVAATNNIAAGETLATIPVVVSMDHPCLVAVKEAVAHLSLTLQLAMAVLYLLHTPDDHVFKPYFNTLPRAVTNALQLTDEHRAALRGTSIEDELNVAIMEQRHKTVVLPILQQHRSLWPRSSYSFDAFKHAVFLLMSRGFFCSDIGGPYLVPVADAFNHSNDHRCTHLELENGVFRMKAERDIAKGEEVFNTYGPIGNARLFHTYGFIEQGNRFNEVHLSRQLVVDACEEWCVQQRQTPALLKRKREVLECCKLLLDVFVLDKADMLPNVFLTVLQVYAMEEDEFAAFQVNPALLGADFDADDPTFVAAVYALTIHVVGCKLRSYAGAELSLKQEQAAITAAEQAGDGPQRCILTIRHEERRMLMELQAQVVQELRELREAEVEGEAATPVDEVESSDEDDESESSAG